MTEQQQVNCVRTIRLSKPETTCITIPHTVQTNKNFKGDTKYRYKDSCTL